jgi:hypothetical protein
VRYIPGAIDEMAPHTLEMVQTFQSVLGLPPVSEDITSDPLASGEATAPDTDRDTPKVTEKAASASPAPQKVSAPKRAARKAPAKPAAARKPGPRKPRSTAGKKEEPAE